MQQNYIYLDNNATTRCCDESTKVMTDWIQSCSNPSGSSWLSKASKLLMDKSQHTINTFCNLNNEYYVLFTSGASESNCTVLQMTVEAWYRNVGTIPHIITSKIEHKSILECLSSFDKRVLVTFVEPDMYGIINPRDIEAEIKKNTALITIMFANNELGAINQVRKIGEIAHKHHIPFHTDAVQIFGKIQLDSPSFNIDALSMSFHKLYGPTGVGMLILRKAFVDGYGLRGQIAGSQQFGLRGGTENIPGIAGATAAIIQNFKCRKAKNDKLLTLRNLLIQLLSKQMKILPYKDFYGKTEFPGLKGRSLCILGPPATMENCYLPSTVLLSVLDFDNEFCNVKLKAALEKQGVIVAIGSACNTTSAKASHVVESIKAPPIIKRGILRISIGDLNTTNDIHNFVKILIQSINTIS